MRWGIASTGEIARSMARAFLLAEHSNLLAVSSRAQKRADEFAREHHVPRAYGSLEAMLDDAEVDIVYVAGPHSTHFDYAEKALGAGKHVLCEKAFTINAPQAEKLIDMARKRKLFLMEAMWMRFFPVMEAIRSMMRGGEFGSIRYVAAEFCLHMPYNPKHRLFNPELGGGALLDLGVYPLSFAQMVLGRFDEVQGACVKDSNGVDVFSSMSLRSVSGGIASLSTGFTIRTPCGAHIYGDDAEAFIPENFFNPHRLIIRREGKDDREMEFPIEGDGHIYEIRHIEECIASDKTESPLMTLDDSLEIMRTTDKLRRLWNFLYPEENLGEIGSPGP